MGLASRYRTGLPSLLAVLAVLLGGIACRPSQPSPPPVSSPPPSPPPEHSWPDAVWRPYGRSSPFNWVVPADPTVLANSTSVVDSLLRLSGCAAGDQTTYGRCKPNNLTAYDDHTSGGGWPTYYLLPTDPDVTVMCTGNPCPFPSIMLKMPEGARRQIGSPDRHLTIVDRNGDSGLHKANWEYDFYQFEPDVIPQGGNSATAFAEASLSLDGLGQQDGNTNAAGIGNLAGRIRVEELAAGAIGHALTVAVPCTKGGAPVWPANHFAVSAGCDGSDPNLPAMGQLLWLDMDEAQVNSNPTTANSAPWVKTVLKAMHTYGMYVNDNGGLGASYFQLQTEAQAQYPSLGASDPWLDYAQTHWIRSSTDPAYFGPLQGPLPSSPLARQQWVDDWQAIWRHLHVIDPCTVPRPTPC